MANLVVNTVTNLVVNLVMELWVKLIDELSGVLYGNMPNAHIKGDLKSSIEPKIGFGVIITDKNIAVVLCVCVSV